MRQLAGTRDYAVRGGVGSGCGGGGGGEERDELIGSHTYRQTDKQTDRHRQDREKTETEKDRDKTERTTHRKAETVRLKGGVEGGGG